MRKHTMDLIFSLSLFMIFVIGSFLLLLFQINGYHHLQEEDHTIYQTASYIQTIVKGNDQKGAIQVETIKGIPCLVILQEEATTYLYQQEGYLMELYQAEDLPVDLSLGERRYALSRFLPSIEDGVLTVEIMDDQTKVCLTLRLRSEVNLI